MDPDQQGARILAENVGFEIVEAEGRVWFFDRRSRGPAITALVSGGVAAITTINACLQAVATLTGVDLGGGPWIVALLISLAILASFVCYAAIRLRRRRLDRPRAELRPLAMVDREAATLLDADGRVIAPVAEVRGGRGMNLGGSAPAVFIKAPGRARIKVFEGSVFGGGIDRAVEALAELGFAR